MTVAYLEEEFVMPERYRLACFLPHVRCMTETPAVGYDVNENIEERRKEVYTRHGQRSECIQEFGRSLALRRSMKII